VLQLLLLYEGTPPALVADAIRAIGRCRLANQSERLVVRLRDPDAAVQDAAIEALGRIGRAAAFDPLLALWDARDGALRAPLRLALRRIATPARAAADELPALATDATAPRVLAIHDDLRLERTLDLRRARACLLDRSPLSRADAAVLLGLLGGPADAAALGRLRREDPDAEVRRAAELGLRGLELRA
jgi:hypothetical protein